MRHSWIGSNALYTATPALKKTFREDKKNILVLGTVTYHHGYHEEDKVPESDSKYNTGLLRRHGVKRIRAERTSGDCQSRTAITARNFDVPEVGENFPRAISASGNGVSKEIALATRTHFQVHHPEKLLEKV